jgi:hypothetical protein
VALVLVARYECKKPVPTEEKLAATTPPFSGEVKNKWRYLSTPPFGSITCIGTTLPSLY